MVKLQQNGDGDREITSLSISQTLQIAGTKITPRKYSLKMKIEKDVNT